MGERGSICIRDQAGFCLIALWGNPKCFRGPEKMRCDETDVDAAYGRLIACAKRRHSANPTEIERDLR